MLNWTNELDYSISEKAVSSQARRARNVKYLLVGTDETAAAVGINLFDAKAVQLIG